MDWENITILCNTPYQLIVASYLRYTDFKDGRVTLLLSDQIRDCQQLKNNIIKTEMFHSVGLVCKDTFKRMEGSRYRRGMFHLMKGKYASKWLKQCSDFLPEKCDIFLCANVELYVVAFCECYACRMELFEDGIASYSRELGDFYNEIAESFAGGKKKRFRCYSEAKAIYLFNPENLKWCPFFNVKKMEPFYHKKDFLQILNQIFGYTSGKDAYSQKYIFFEEAYESDGRVVNDIEIVEVIASIVGKENLLIKQHPRSLKNRFGELGFHTNTKCNIPWEVIALNTCLEEKVVITIASAAAITPYLLLGMEMRAVVLYKLFPDAPLKRNVLEVFETVCEECPNIGVPDTREELRAILQHT